MAEQRQDRDDSVVCSRCEMIARDNRALRIAGGGLAIAAAHVVTEYDGLHRLSLAIAAWHKALADEGGSGDHQGGEDHD